MSSAFDQIRSARQVLRASIPVGVSRACIALCASPARLATLERAALRIGAFRPPPETAPRVPIPHTIAIAPLDDGLELELLAIPLASEYAPLWPLALAAAQVVVRIDAVGAGELDAACATLGLVPVDVEKLGAGFSEEDEDQVANMLRAAAEQARG